MLVRWLFPSINTACSSRSVRSCPASELLAQVDGSHSFFTGLQEMHPSATHVNPQAVSCPRSASKVCLGGLAVTGFWGKECTLTPSIRSESELLDLHGPRGLKKKQRQRQTVQTEEMTFVPSREDSPKTSRSPS